MSTKTANILFFAVENVIIDFKEKRYQIVKMPRSATSISDISDLVVKESNIFETYEKVLWR